MATAEQIKSLIRSHLEEDGERFYTVALQLAAHEARQGHSSLAHEIKSLVDKSRQTRKQALVRFPNELEGLILTEEPKERLAVLVLEEGQRERIERILSEYRQRETLKNHGLDHRRKVLLSGPPGTGKTLTARILASELMLPLRTIQVDRLVTKFMGETSAKLRQIFDVIESSKGVFLFDEFDAIGGDRGRDNDVGEMRRVLNAFLQFIDADRSENVIVAATNNPNLLDRALFRRFDDILRYGLPDKAERLKLLKNLLASFKTPRFPFAKAATAAEGLSQAEIASAARDAIKNAILAGKETVESESLLNSLHEKQHAYLK
ncbi:ATP-binding protein [Pelagicoccus sp. NFK12]|uniref:ATP-binding protein n=1 Tax=Pelagicoccus enzymogenes TaxID=2773457 RepID=A0A927F8F3_9BACT|nr:ATP-binding protein [Pelagicoccus enzymogenes]MBD5779636.1 ATP-binding protein [Pelagicoccus enzymogenes]